MLQRREDSTFTHPSQRYGLPHARRRPAGARFPSALVEPSNGAHGQYRARGAGVRAGGSRTRPAADDDVRAWSRGM